MTRGWERLRSRMAPRFDALGSRLFRFDRGEGGSVAIRDELSRWTGSSRPLWTITTYDRPASCERLVEELGRAAQDSGVEPLVVVIRDACTSDYGNVRDALRRNFGERGLIIESTCHLGKHEFWRTHQLFFDLVEVLRPPHTLSLQDDIELLPGWYDEAWSIVHALDDPQLAAISLFRTEDDEENGRWVTFRREPTECGRALLTQWLDLAAFIAMPMMYELLHHHVYPISRSRWFFDPSKSSGVGRQITRRLFRQRSCVYHVASPLALHGGEPSRMNVEARLLDPLDNRPRECLADRSAL